MSRKSEVFGGFWMVPKGTKGLSLEARFILGMLVTRMNGENEAWPSHQWIANEMGCSKRSVIRYMKELEGHGHLVKTRTGLGLSNRYRLSTPGDKLSLQEVTAVSLPEVPNCHFPLYIHRDSVIRTIPPTPQGGDGVDKKWGRGNRPKRKRPCLEGYPAFYDETRQVWRTQNCHGEWVDYIGDVKKNLTYQER